MHDGDTAHFKAHDFTRFNHVPLSPPLERKTHTQQHDITLPDPQNQHLPSHSKFEFFFICARSLFRSQNGII